MLKQALRKLLGPASCCMDSTTQYAAGTHTPAALPAQAVQGDWEHVEPSPGCTVQPDVDGLAGVVVAGVVGLVVAGVAGVEGEATQEEPLPGHCVPAPYEP